MDLIYMIVQYTIIGVFPNLMFVAFLVFTLFNIIFIWGNRHNSARIRIYRL